MAQEPSRAEVEAAFRNYWRIGALEERWSEWGQVFTEDVVYVEHIYGTMKGRTTVQEWIDRVMAKNHHVHAILDWYMIEGRRVVFNMQNRYYNPDPNSDEPYFDFPGITVLEYGENGQFRYEEDYWDLRLAKECHARFSAALEEFGDAAIEETPERMKLRDPWPD